MSMSARKQDKASTESLPALTDLLIQFPWILMQKALKMKFIVLCICLFQFLLVYVVQVLLELQNKSLYRKI